MRRDEFIPALEVHPAKDAAMYARDIPQGMALDVTIHAKTYNEILGEHEHFAFAVADDVEEDEDEGHVAAAKDAAKLAEAREALRKVMEILE